MELRIIQGSACRGLTPVRLLLYTSGNRMRLSAKASALSLPDDELMRQWYLENYRHESAEAVSGIASQLREKMILAGISLFERVFLSSEPGRKIWRAIAPKLASTRIEVRSRGPALPWEHVRPIHTIRRWVWRVKPWCTGTEPAAKTSSRSAPVLSEFCWPSAAPVFPPMSTFVLWRGCSSITRPSWHQAASV